MEIFGLRTSVNDADFAALAAKYDVPGPRYTSYPTALQFSDAFTAADYQREASREKAGNVAPLSLYVHIPFCRNICYYCACNKIITNDMTAARTYLDYLRKEIGLQSELFNRRRQVTQLHFGGGTPTSLPHAKLTELMYLLARHFQLIDLPSREYSIEIDPRTIGVDTLALLKGLGFNRLSFGIQDFDERVQEAVNRIQSVDSVAELVHAARDYGFNSISFDLIYGLPYQNTDSLRATLDKVIALQPNRIACYNYAHLPERFPSQRAIDRLQLPSAEQKLAMYLVINRTLREAGYHFIGMDHYVRPGDDLELAQRHGKLQRNFQGYSTILAPELVGLGVSAISALSRCYAQNEKELETYYQRLDRDEIPVCRGLVMTRDDEIRRYVIMQLICNFTLDTQEFSERFGEDFLRYFAPELPALAVLADDGLVEWRQEKRELVITDIGRMLVRNVCMVFDRYLVETASQRYSRVI